MLKKVIMASVALVLIGGAGFLITQNFAPQDPNENDSDITTVNTNPESPNKSTVSSAPGSYEEYSPEKLQKAEDGQVVLFFNAVWCPDCRATVRDIEANLMKIPSELTILSVDYDKYQSLKQKYGVTYQHTFVQVDSDGNQIKKWGGSLSLDQIVARTE